MNDGILIYDRPELYDRIVLPGPCERFYRDHARQARGPVLELACGTGRLTIPIARDGHSVIGVDRSEAMLARAREKAQRANIHVDFVSGDMRDFRLHRRFALIIVSCNSLAHLTSNDDLRACLSSVRQHLAPGGAFVFDIVNPDVGVLARLTGGHTLLGRFGKVTIEEARSYEADQQVVSRTWRVHRPGAPAVRFAPLRLRQVFPPELPLLLSSEGLQLAVRSGDFEAGPFRSSSSNQVCVARAS